MATAEIEHTGILEQVTLEDLMERHGMSVRPTARDEYMCINLWC